MKVLLLEDKKTLTLKDIETPVENDKNILVEVEEQLEEYLHKDFSTIKAVLRPNI